MLAPWQQARFRPMVQKAWEEQCRLTGRRVSDRAAKDRWYRDALWSTCHIHSTKEAAEDQYRDLIRVFTMLSECDQVTMLGWTDSQNAAFHKLADRAWRRECERHTVDGIEFADWLDARLFECDIINRHAPDRVKSFDQVMANLAVIAGDEYWIDKTSRAAEDRMRWQIQRLMDRLAQLQERTVDWEYVRGIYDQAHLLPADMSDAPARVLWRVLQMLDTHVRRLEAQGQRRDDRPA